MKYVNWQCENCAVLLVPGARGGRGGRCGCRGSRGGSGGGGSGACYRGSPDNRRGERDELALADTVPLVGVHGSELRLPNHWRHGHLDRQIDTGRLIDGDRLGHVDILLLDVVDWEWDFTHNFDRHLDRDWTVDILLHYHRHGDRARDRPIDLHRPGHLHILHHLPLDRDVDVLGHVLINWYLHGYWPCDLHRVRPVNRDLNLPGDLVRLRDGNVHVLADRVRASYRNIDWHRHVDADVDGDRYRVRAGHVDRDVDGYGHRDLHRDLHVHAHGSWHVDRNIDWHWHGYVSWHLNRDVYRDGNINENIDVVGLLDRVGTGDIDRDSYRDINVHHDLNWHRHIDHSGHGDWDGHRAGNRDIDGHIHRYRYRYLALHLDRIRFVHRHLYGNIDWNWSVHGDLNGNVDRDRHVDGDIDRNIDRHGYINHNGHVDRFRYGPGHWYRYRDVDWVRALHRDLHRDGHRYSHFDGHWDLNWNGIRLGYRLVHNDLNSAGNIDRHWNLDWYRDSPFYLNWNVYGHGYIDPHFDWVWAVSWDAHFNRNVDLHGYIHRNHHVHSDWHRALHLPGDSDLDWNSVGAGYCHRPPDRSNLLVHRLHCDNGLHNRLDTDLDPSTCLSRGHVLVCQSLGSLNSRCAEVAYKGSGVGENCSRVAVE